jgi:hypothetical protein
MPRPNPDAALFWELAEPMLAAGDATRGTMMGHPCLRVDGAFFATAGHEADELIVKLPARRVEELIDQGTGQPFAPAGRRFREWVAVPAPDRELWSRLLREARQYAAVPRPEPTASHAADRTIRGLPPGH